MDTAARRDLARQRLWRAYVDAWFPALLQSAAGPHGVTYAERTGGSPIPALRAAVESRPAPSADRPVTLLFADPRDGRHPALRDAAEPEFSTEFRAWPGVTVGAGPALDGLLDAHGSWGRPLLAVLDAAVPEDDAGLLRRIAFGRAGEVLLTAGPAADPERHRRALVDAGFAYTLDLRLADRRRDLLYLAFGTNTPAGLARMKDAMWSVEPVAGVGYRDPRDPARETVPVEPEPRLAPLRRLVLEHLRDRPKPRATVDELQRFALLDTIYKPAPTMRVVQSLVRDRLLTRRDAGTLRLTSEVQLAEYEQPSLF